MSITLTLASGERKEISSDLVIIGSDPSCQFHIPNQHGIHPKHAKIRKVAGKWIAESEGDWNLKVDNGVAARKCWLKDVCEVHLTEVGPSVLFSTMASPEQADSQHREQPNTIGQTPETKDRLLIWHYSKGDQKFGPVSFQQLAQLAEEVKLFPHDLIWKEGMSEWQPAQVVKGLFTEASKDTPPLPKSLASPAPLLSEMAGIVHSPETSEGLRQFWKDWGLAVYVSAGGLVAVLIFTAFVRNFIAEADLSTRWNNAFSDFNGQRWLGWWVVPAIAVFVFNCFRREETHEHRHYNTRGDFVGFTKVPTGRYIEGNPYGGLVAGVFWMFGYLAYWMIHWSYCFFYV